MGAMTLLEPGRGGPCLKVCRHSSCDLHRRLASAVCPLCSRPLGYLVPVYCYRKRLGHVACIEDGINRTLARFAEDLAELAVDHYLKTELGYSDSDIADSRTARYRAHPKRREENLPRLLATPPFMLAACDFQVLIPSGRTRSPTISIEDHNTLVATRRAGLSAEYRRISPPPSRYDEFAGRSRCNRRRRAS